MRETVAVLLATLLAVTPGLLHPGDAGAAPVMVSSDVESAESVRDVQFSPHGDRLAFVMRTQDFHYDLYVVGVDGTGLRWLDTDLETRHVTAGEVWDVRVTADGSHVVYRTDRDGDGHHELRSASMAGGGPVRVDVAGEAGVVAVGLAGARVVYSVGEAPGGTPDVSAVYSVALDGTGTVELTDESVPLGGINLGVTASGSHAVLWVDDYDGATSLWGVPVTGGTPVRLDEDDGVIVSFQVVGERAVWRQRDAGSAVTVLSVAVDGGAPTRLSTEEMGAEVSVGPGSPDAEHVLLRSSAGIWIVPLAGGEPIRLDDPPADPLSLAFTPDGRHVVAGIRRDGHTALYALPVDGGDPIDLTDGLVGGGVNFAGQAVALDSGHVVFLTSSSGSVWSMDLWRAEVTTGERVHLAGPFVSGQIPVGELHLARDLNRVVFLESSAGRTIMSVPVDGGAPLALADSDPLYSLHVSPDGRRVAWTVWGDQTVIGPGPELWTTAVDRGVGRLAGPDRFATAARTSLALGARAETVYLATGRGFADALAVGPLAARDGLPVLLTEPDELPGVTRERLVALAPQRVVIVGGPAAVSENVADAVRAATGGEVVRIGGPNRYATAAEVAARFDRVAVAYVASGEAFPDALSAAALAGRQRVPVLLSEPGALPDVTRDALVRLSPATVVVAGGPNAIADEVLDAIDSATGAEVLRVWGPDRYATSAALAARFPGEVAEVHLATGWDFPDALVAVPIAARSGGPVLLIDRNVVPPVIDAQLARLAPERIVVMGGEAAVPHAVASLLHPHIR